MPGSNAGHPRRRCRRAFAAAAVVFGDAQGNGPKFPAAIGVQRHANLLVRSVHRAQDQGKSFAPGDRKGAETIGKRGFPNLAQAALRPFRGDHFGTCAVVIRPAELSPVNGGNAAGKGARRQSKKHHCLEFSHHGEHSISQESHVSRRIGHDLRAA